MQETVNCRICAAEIQKWERYPNLVCASCAARASDDQGRRLEFYNESFSGGFLASYADTGEKFEGHICYIDGVKCRADEHRFGGIVIQVVKE